VVLLFKDSKAASAFEVRPRRALSSVATSTP
jgi:hypothetical protein